NRASDRAERRRSDLGREHRRRSQKRGKVHRRIAARETRVSTRVVNVHATCVRLARAGEPFQAPPDAGVLILGVRGAGQWDLALRLIAAGSVLVADDRTELFVRRGRLRARAPKPIIALMEIRGLGVVDVPYTEEVQVTLVAELAERVVRMPSPAF